MASLLRSYYRKKKKTFLKGIMPLDFTNCALPLLFSQYIVLQKVDKSWTKELD